MVFFTCNACGQSIRKSRVEKHWQTECRNCEVLSCMDCGKDFYGEEYAAHTSCISEAEKYQGALFKGEKGGSTKGEKKQQEWIHNLTNMMSTQEFSSRIKGLLERILEYPNIPRKKAKFQNFLKNSINVRDWQTLERLWEIFSEAGQVKAIDTPTITTDTPTPETTSATTGNGAENDAEKDVELTDDITTKKKKKKKDQSKENDVDLVNSSKDIETKKKKKKSKNKEIEDIDVHLSDGVSKKKKSKKRKRHEENGDEGVQEDDKTTDEGDVVKELECSIVKKAKVDSSTEGSKVKKKKKSKTKA